MMIAFIIGLLIGSLITACSMKVYFDTRSALAASSIIAKVLIHLDDNTQQDILGILRNMNEK